MKILIIAFQFIIFSASAQVTKVNNLQLIGGTPGLNKVLVSDANGNATWQELETLGLTPSFKAAMSTTGKVWMDRNLGATRVATSMTDHLAYGSLYQWGRGSDGHQLINWTSSTAGTAVNGTTATTSSTNTPGNALFITGSDWRNPQNNNLWQGVSGINNPCPLGYRLPTNTELTAEIVAYNITSNATAYASHLKFTVPGYRDNSNGSLYDVGGSGTYWTSTVSGTSATGRYWLTASTTISNFDRTYGFTVRCLKD